VPDCPHEKLIALYHELLPTCTQVVEWNDAAQGHRSSAVAGEGRAKPGYRTVEDGLAYWRRFFEYVAGSKFLTGKAEPGAIASRSWRRSSGCCGRRTSQKSWRAPTTRERDQRQSSRQGDGMEVIPGSVGERQRREAAGRWWQAREAGEKPRGAAKPEKANGKGREGRHRPAGQGAARKR
jgi:hypothetical protein